MRHFEECGGVDRAEELLTHECAVRGPLRACACAVSSVRASARHHFHRASALLLEWPQGAAPASPRRMCMPGRRSCSASSWRRRRGWSPPCTTTRPSASDTMTTATGAATRRPLKNIHNTKCTNTTTEREHESSASCFSASTVVIWPRHSRKRGPWMRFEWIEWRVYVTFTKCSDIPADYSHGWLH